jgi:hypothetical protein
MKGVVAETFERLLKDSKTSGAGARLTEECIDSNKQAIDEIRSAHKLGEGQAMVVFFQTQLAAMEVHFRIMAKFQSKVFSMLMGMAITEEQSREMETALRKLTLDDVLDSGR